MRLELDFCGEPTHRSWDFWTADGWLHRDSGQMTPCEEALCWYDDEHEWYGSAIDVGGEG